MDLAQVFIFVAGWIFFAAWGVVLAAVSIIAFGRDLTPWRGLGSPASPFQMANPHPQLGSHREPLDSIRQ